MCLLLCELLLPPRGVERNPFISPPSLQWFEDHGLFACLCFVSIPSNMLFMPWVAAPQTNVCHTCRCAKAAQSGYDGHCNGCVNAKYPARSKEKTGKSPWESSRKRCERKWKCGLICAGSHWLSESLSWRSTAYLRRRSCSSILRKCKGTMMLWKRRWIVLRYRWLKLKSKKNVRMKL